MFSEWMNIWKPQQKYDERKGQHTTIRQYHILYKFIINFFFFILFIIIFAFVQNISLKNAKRFENINVRWHFVSGKHLMWNNNNCKKKYIFLIISEYSTMGLFEKLHMYFVLLFFRVEIFEYLKAILSPHDFIKVRHGSWDLQDLYLLPCFQEFLQSLTCN